MDLTNLPIQEGVRTRGREETRLEGFVDASSPTWACAAMGTALPLYSWRRERARGA